MMRAVTLSRHHEPDLWEMEEHFWTAGLDAARGTSATGAVMILPYAPGILQGQTIWQHLKDQPLWRTITMTEKTYSRQKDVAVLAYHASAEREGAPIYEALCVSTYLHDDGRWVRLSHQETPVV